MANFFIFLETGFVRKKTPAKKIYFRPLLVQMTEKTEYKTRKNSEGESCIIYCDFMDFMISLFHSKKSYLNSKYLNYVM